MKFDLFLRENFQTNSITEPKTLVFMAKGDDDEPPTA